MSCFRYRGPDMGSSTQTEIIHLREALNNILCRYGSDWTVYVEAQRVEIPAWETQDLENKNAEEFDRARNEYFFATDKFENIFYMSFLYKPPTDAKSKTEEYFFDIPEEMRGNIKEGIAYKHLEIFNTTLEQHGAMFKKLFVQFERLDGDELLTYLHSTVSVNRHKVARPPYWACLDHILTDCEFTGGIQPKLGHKYLGIVGIKNFPSSTSPGVLKALLELPFEVRWSSRFIILDKLKAQKLCRKLEKSWFGSRKSMGTMLIEIITGNESRLVDKDAERRSTDVSEVKTLVSAEDVILGYTTVNVLIFDEDPERLAEKIKQVQTVFNTLGFVTFHERLNATDAFFSSLPGLPEANVRIPPVDSRNFLHLVPVHALWQGPEWNRHLNGPPVLIASSGGGSPFRFSHHVQDVGHSIVLGPTGAGKSFFLNLWACQFLRYPGAQVIFIDNGKSSMASTLCMGGEFYDVGDMTKNLEIQPLANLEDENQFKWAVEFVASLLYINEFEVTPDVLRLIHQSLTSMRNTSPEMRTISFLESIISDQRIRTVLRQYTKNGIYKIMDGARNSIGSNRWIAFEMGNILESPKLAKVVLMYLFQQIDARLNGNPTAIFLDEAWLLLSDPVFVTKINEWVKVLRKKNASIIFATQSLADVIHSKIFHTIFQNCPTKIYLPDMNAMEQGAKELYDTFGLNSQERRILATAMGKQDYYFTSPEGRRLFTLDPGRVERLVCGSSTPVDHEQLIRISKSKPENFMRAFLAEKGVNL